jgi:hypothetical protein
MQHGGFGGSGRGSGWAWLWAQRGIGGFGGVFGGGLGGVVGARGAAWWWSSCPRLHVRTRASGRHPKEAPPRNQIETPRGLRATASRAREPRARTQTATRRNRKTKIGSQITAWGNSESRRQSRDQTPTQVLIRDVDLRLCGFASQPTCHDRASRGKRGAR